MIIGKVQNILFILILFVILQGCDMFEDTPEPVFKVYGDPSILEKMVINVENSINDARYPGYPVSKVQTQLYKGKQQSFQNMVVISYAIYFSYENQVNKLIFDNLMGNKQGHINHIYVFKKDDGIYLKYYGLESDIQKKVGPTSETTITLEEYFKMNGILDEQDQRIYKNRFFDFFDPDTQVYYLQPLDKETIEYFKGLSLEEKKKYGLPTDYLKQMDLSEGELKELLKLSKEN